MRCISRHLPGLRPGLALQPFTSGLAGFFVALEVGSVGPCRRASSGQPSRRARAARLPPLLAQSLCLRPPGPGCWSGRLVTCALSAPLSPAGLRWGASLATLLTLPLFSQAKDLPTFKDNDFLNEGQKLHVGEESKKNFLEKLKRDVEVLTNLVSKLVEQAPLFCGAGASSRKNGVTAFQEQGTEGRVAIRAVWVGTRT